MVSYRFVADTLRNFTVQVSLVPNHPVDGESIRYAIQIDTEKEQIVDFSTKGRSEEWKENVLTNRTQKTTHHTLNRTHNKQINIKIRALDGGVFIDQIKVWDKR